MIYSDARFLPADGFLKNWDASSVSAKYNVQIVNEIEPVNEYVTTHHIEEFEMVVYLEIKLFITVAVAEGSVREILVHVIDKFAVCGGVWYQPRGIPLSHLRIPIIRGAGDLSGRIVGVSCVATCLRVGFVVGGHVELEVGLIGILRKHPWDSGISCWLSVQKFDLLENFYLQNVLVHV